MSGASMILYAVISKEERKNKAVLRGSKGNGVRLFEFRHRHKDARAIEQEFKQFVVERFGDDFLRVSHYFIAQNLFLFKVFLKKTPPLKKGEVLVSRPDQASLIYLDPNKQLTRKVVVGLQ